MSSQSNVYYSQRADIISVLSCHHYHSPQTIWSSTMTTSHLPNSKCRKPFYRQIKDMQVGAELNIPPLWGREKRQGWRSVPADGGNGKFCWAATFWKKEIEALWLNVVCHWFSFCTWLIGQEWTGLGLSVQTPYGSTLNFWVSSWDPRNLGFAGLSTNCYLKLVIYKNYKQKEIGAGFSAVWKYPDIYSIA